VRTAVYPGSFDPITNGHLDILSRATSLFDKIIIAVLANPAKQPLLDVKTRVKLIQESTKNMPGVEVGFFSALTVQYAVEKDASVLIRGLRALSDFERELQMSQANKNINPDIETVFLMCSLEYAFLSSSMVKEICFLGGDISDVVPECVNKHLSKLREMRLQNDYK
jgi:pantetheine-phosphate adenylyltransferase